MDEKMYLKDNTFGFAKTHKLGNSYKIYAGQSFGNAVFYLLGQKQTTVKAVDYSEFTG